MMPDPKSMSLNYKELFDFEGAPKRENRGTPENEGISLAQLSQLRGYGAGK
jgi:hypothetical protein